ncbi:MBG domain-containing protein, partial [Acetobacterium tundrae]
APSASIDGSTPMYSTDGGKTWTAEAPSFTNVGTYPVSVKEINPNYADSPVVETSITITPAPATITIDPQTKVYGTKDDPALTAVVGGTVTGENLNYTLSRVAGETVGTYAITATVGANPNYNITVTDNSLIITAATATITIDQQSKVYGSADPIFTAVVSGTVNGETLNYTLNREAGEDVGKYVIKTTDAVAADNLNYSITVVPGTLEITPKAVTITADDKTKVYGQSDPILTATIDGLIGTDTLNYNLSRDPGEAVGTYAIRVNFEQMNVYSDSEVSTEAYRDINSNYDVTAVNGILTITPSVVVNYYDINYLAGADGVTNMPSNQTNIVAGSQQIVSTQIPVRSGYTFEGWNVSGATAVDGQFTMPGNTVNITANWKANQYDLNITY